ILRATGFKDFSGDKSSKEKFLLDLEGLDSDQSTSTEEDIISRNIFGDIMSEGDYRQMYIACDEFNDFIGLGNFEFISLLGSFWDWDDSVPYENRLKNSRTVIIPNPTIGILGGNTATNFKMAFPPDTQGQGFFSRLLLIYGEPKTEEEDKITFPENEDPNKKQALVNKLIKIRDSVKGTATFSEDAKRLLDIVYKKTKPMTDPRFQNYWSRRLTHILKLCLILSAARCSVVIEAQDVVYANSLLTYTERLMPKALGEFGRSRHSETVHKIMSVLNKADKPYSFIDLWKIVSTDLDNMDQLRGILGGLNSAEKIQLIGSGFLGRREVFSYSNSEVLNFDFLTQEERENVNG
ncbi:MAG TPA: DUF3987 domain-containing protein, partial [Candidatus Nitrosocosmicus sp.]|nr:DUF3987 domain-containing protein [Candidatus Nitrosocosmicus sp.]